MITRLAHHVVAADVTEDDFAGPGRYFHFDMLPYSCYRISITTTTPRRDADSRAMEDAARDGRFCAYELPGFHALLAARALPVTPRHAYRHEGYFKPLPDRI